MSEPIDASSEFLAYMRYCWQESRKCRELALRRRDQVYATVAREFRNTGRSSFGDLELVQLKRTTEDWEYKMNMGDCNWFRDEALAAASMLIAERLYAE